MFKWANQTLSPSQLKSGINVVILKHQFVHILPVVYAHKFILSSSMVDCFLHKFDYFRLPLFFHTIADWLYRLSQFVVDFTPSGITICVPVITDGYLYWMT